MAKIFEDFSINSRCHVTGATTDLHSVVPTTRHVHRKFSAVGKLRRQIWFIAFAKHIRTRILCRLNIRSSWYSAWIESLQKRPTNRLSKEYWFSFTSKRTVNFHYWGREEMSKLWNSLLKMIFDHCMIDWLIESFCAESELAVVRLIYWLTRVPWKKPVCSDSIYAVHQLLLRSKVKTTSSI